MIHKEIVTIILAAGFGKRLLPLTSKLPKCLMPINGRPLLEYWLNMLYKIGLKRVIVNTHYLAQDVSSFLARKIFTDWVIESYEPQILGTAGTIRNNKHLINNSDILLIHGDNWCQCNLEEFIEYHFKHRPNKTLITMMIFETNNPSQCGIVELNERGIVIGFHEKVGNPPGNLANAAIYMISNEVVKWIIDNPSITDFSTEVIPKFIGKTATWKNKNILRDIGSIKELIKSQTDYATPVTWDQNDDWYEFFLKSEAFLEINNFLNSNIVNK